MSFVEIVLIALGLSMDAFAVSISKGLSMRGRLLKQALIIAVAFGLFQGGMPLIGWFVGSHLANAIESYDHWIAFGLLAFIGGKMLWEAFRGEEATEDVEPGFSIREVLILAVATSIDALAAGVGFAFLNVNIWLTVASIALITGVLSFAGVEIGRRFGSRFEKPASIAGGVILVLIGVKILLSHLGYIAF